MQFVGSRLCCYTWHTGISVLWWHTVCCYVTQQSQSEPLLWIHCWVVWSLLQMKPEYNNCRGLPEHRCALSLCHSSGSLTQGFVFMDFSISFPGFVFLCLCCLVIIWGCWGSFLCCLHVYSPVSVSSALRQTVDLPLWIFTVRVLRSLRLSA